MEGKKVKIAKKKYGTTQKVIHKKREREKLEKILFIRMHENDVIIFKITSRLMQNMMNRI